MYPWHPSDGDHVDYLGTQLSTIRRLLKLVAKSKMFCPLALLE